jgi:hypothetical protein
MAQAFSWNPPAWSSWLQWHWNGKPPDNQSGWSIDWRRRGPAVMPAPDNVTVKELQEIYDPVWFLLNQHGVTADCTAYQLAMEITHKLIGIRDRQLEQRASAT